MSELATQGYSLCMSNVVGASEEGNVATVALPPIGEHAYSTTNKFSWNVAYSIGAMNVPWQDGVQVESQSEVVAVPIGQCYELDEWSSPPKIIKGVAGKLQFTTNKYDAAPVVYLAKVTANSNKVAPAPIYVAPELVVFPGTDVLTPKVAVIIYFAQDIVTSTMTSNTSTERLDIDLTDQLTGQVWALGEDHKWNKMA